MHATLPLLQVTAFPAIRRRTVETLQVNIGYECNRSCVHCHVNAGPTRTESMSRETLADVLADLQTAGCSVAKLRLHRIGKNRMAEQSDPFSSTHADLG